MTEKTIYLVTSIMDITDRKSKNKVSDHRAVDPIGAANQHKAEFPARFSGENWAIYVLDFVRNHFEGTLTRHGWKPREPSVEGESE